jgi:membrane associated rhomboid family serine protease
VIPLKDSVPTERFPWVTVVFIVANVIVYFVLQGGGILSGPDQDVVIEYGAIPYEITHPGDHCEASGEQLICEGQEGVVGEAGDQAPTWLTLFTSMFMHGSILHLGGNMLFLWIFGNNVEDSMGPVKFLLFYLLGGIAAAALQIAIDPGSQIPNLGASGAVAGVLGGYLLLFPRARVVTVVFIIFFFTILELPAILFLVIWIGQQFLFGYFDLVGSDGEGGVAYFAHIGGFVFGLLLIRAFASEKRHRRQLERAGMA